MLVSWWAFIGVLALSTLARAQSTTATLGGTVFDETGAVVPNVQVTVVNLGNGLQRKTIAGAQGTFVISLLPPGGYRLTAQHDGFSPAEIPQLVLNVGDDLKVQVLLKVARVDASVTVTAAPAPVSTSPAVASVVDRTFVQNLPLNGRSFQSLITMTPGVVLTPASSTSPGQFSVNGQRSDANYFMVDGVSANVGVVSGTALGVAGAGAVPGVSAQGGTNSLVSVDAMQEFKIQTSTYAPEFGRTPGGQISIVTRSGTNQFHGSIFEYFRNDALDAADYFVKLKNLPTPKEHQHDFGGVFGGPIQRDRAFVFVSYEGLRLDQPRSLVTEVPSLASRAAASDALRPIVAAFPLPNGPDTSGGLAQFSASYSDPSTLNATSVRVDRTFGNALTLFGRYNYAPSDAASRFGSFAIASANTVGTLQNSLQTVTVGTTSIITPTLSNELRVNWSRNVGTNFQTLDTFGAAIVPPATILHPSFVPQKSAYQINLGAANVLFADGLNASNIQRQINIVDSVQLIRSRHKLKLGIDYRRFFPIYGPLDYVQAYTFNGVAGALAGTTFVNVIAPTGGNRFPHTTNLSAYAQDTWSSSSKLTLAYGLRWELNPPPGLNGNTDFLALATADATLLSLAPAGTPMYHTTFGNVAPRLGATYSLRDTSDRETVIRGGWGIFFDLGSDSVMDNLTSFPFSARRALTNVAFPTSPALLATPTITPGTIVDFLTAADPNLQLPYTQQWNVAIEQALGATSTVSVSYVGAFGRRLLREERLANPTPQFGLVTLVTNAGHSRYNALQTKYTRRLSKGFQALLSYTLADSMDNTSSDVVPVLPSVRVDPEVDWGPSDFDVRHTFSGGLTYSWRGWSVDSIFVARSALPVNVLTGTTAFGVSSSLRPDVLPGVPLYVDDASVPGGRRFNRAAFVNPPLDASNNPLRQGTLGRNALRGFAMSQVDLAVRRDIPLGGGANLQVRVEAFNLFNQDSFGTPTNTLTSGLFGQTTRTLATSLGAGGVAGGGFSPLYQVGGPRSVQLAIKVQF
jgi:carboxypeptidase family protein